MEEVLIGCTEEKKFVFKMATNIGFTQVYNVVVRCIGLSTEAKQLYTALTSYMYQGNIKVSLDRLAFELNMTRKSISKYVKELEQARLISTIRGSKNTVNEYVIEEVHTSNHVVVSEMLWKAVGELYTNSWEDAQDMAKALVKNLASRDATLQDVIPNQDIITMQVNTYKATNLFDLDLLLNKQVPVTEPEPPKEEVKEKPKRKTYKDKEVKDWTAPDFTSYYYDAYDANHTEPHIAMYSQHTAMLKRVLSSLGGDKDKLKLYIDKFFEMNYEIQTLNIFCYNGKLGEIANYIESGVRPFYLKNRPLNIKTDQSEIDDRNERVLKMVGFLNE